MPLLKNLEVLCRVLYRKMPAGRMVLTLSFSVKVLNLPLLENLYFNRNTKFSLLSRNALVSSLKSYFLVRKVTSLNFSVRMMVGPFHFISDGTFLYIYPQECPIIKFVFWKFIITSPCHFSQQIREVLFKKISISSYPKWLFFSD